MRRSSIDQCVTAGRNGRKEAQRTQNELARLVLTGFEPLRREGAKQYFFAPSRLSGSKN